MRTRFVTASVILLFAVSGCAGHSTTQKPSQDAAADGHGDIVGAVELAEPALHLAIIDPRGTVDHLDLLDESVEEIAQIGPLDDLVTDGRYLFAITDGAVTVVDSGVWTWSHGDHFHYYETESRVLGTVEGRGVPTVVPGVNGTGIMFHAEAVLLDTLALADGEIAEEFRVPVEPHAGFVVPLDEGAVITEPDANGAPQSLRVLASDGTEGERIDCADATGTITTVVGVVIGCADGAALAVDGDPSEWERIVYPEGAATAALSFDARKDRPVVAALSGSSGVWLLDTRNRTWTFHDVGRELVRAVAVDDEAESVLLLTAGGNVLVLSHGEVVAETVPLVMASLADPEAAAHVSFVVDRNRAYLNGPQEHRIWEIDPADGGRISRVFDTETAPLHLAGTGR